MSWDVRNFLTPPPALPPLPAEGDTTATGNHARFATNLGSSLEPEGRDTGADRRRPAWRDLARPPWATAHRADRGPRAPPILAPVPVSGDPDGPLRSRITDMSRREEP